MKYNSWMKGILSLIVLSGVLFFPFSVQACEGADCLSVTVKTQACDFEIGIFSDAVILIDPADSLLLTAEDHLLINTVNQLMATGHLIVSQVKVSEDNILSVVLMDERNTMIQISYDGNQAGEDEILMNSLPPNCPSQTSAFVVQRTLTVMLSPGESFNPPLSTSITTSYSGCVFTGTIPQIGIVSATQNPITSVWTVVFLYEGSVSHSACRLP
jgi:hypothetical protein